MAASGGPAAGGGTQSAGRSPHSDIVSPLCGGTQRHKHKCIELGVCFLLATSMPYICVCILWCEP